MQKSFYTNVVKYGNNILYRGIKDGRRVKYKIQYAPTLFLTSNKETEWKSLDGDFLTPMKFENIREANDFVAKYEDVSNFKVYGNTNYAYTLIADEHPDDLEWDIDDIHISFLDIEVGSENGFPDPDLAQEPITAITITRLEHPAKVFGCGDYVVQGKEQYTKCSDEYDLCKKFLKEWVENCPDIITGWNTKFFDIPYVVNRLVKVLGEDEAKKLSPWEVIREKKSFQKITGKEVTSYDIYGIGHLDYLELYKAYAPNGKSQENYRLDTIASVELGEKKIEYDEYDSLHQLYKLNYQKFIEYNIKDVRLVIMLEDKLKLIELALTLAYDSKSNYDDVFTQTRMWDAIIYNYLLKRHIIVPPKEIKEKDSAFEGAYVKEPQVGKHDWIASFDLNSLYPHLIMQYNISPETLIEPKDYTKAQRNIVSSSINVDKMLNKEIDLSGLEDCTITPNCQFFRTDKKGFLPEILEAMYEDRKKYKKLMLVSEQEYENETDEEKKVTISKSIARYKNLQLAKKVGLNSAYGAMGSRFFRFFDIRLALAVTLAGQLSIRWIENKLNGYMNSLLSSDKDYVIASDTDSIYLCLGDLVKKVYGDSSLPKDKIIEFMDRVCERKIQPFIDESYQELADYTKAYAQKMQMKREGLSDKGIWTAKKRYILNVYNNEGVQYKEPHLKVMGLEMVKSSTPQFVREKMEELIKIVVNGTEDDVQKFISSFKQEFKNLPPEDISFPRGCNGLKQYEDSVSIYKKGTPIHVKGAILYNKLLVESKLDKKYQKIQEGEKLKFAYLKKPNPLKDIVISYPQRLPKEFGLHKYIDYDTQFQKTFLDPISVILDCVNWKAEKVNTLDSFF
jgi:DNA polymerase elongation subunit (family B)